MDDRELVERWRAGDRAAFERIIDRYEGRVYAACRSLLRNREDAVDVAQETFLQAFLSIRSLVDESHLAGWLCGIALTLSKGSLRRTLRRRRLWERRPEPPTEEPSPGEFPLDDWLRRLPDEERIALGLRFHAELGHKDVAAAMNLPPAAAKRLVYQGLSNLRTMMRQEHLL